MTGATEFLSDMLPSLIGLLLGLAFVAQAYRLREDLFVVVRTWTLVLLVLSLMALWALTLLEYDTLGSDAHFETSVTFVLVSAWLSTCYMAMTVLYRNYDSVGKFPLWLRRNPLNVFSVWFLIALLIIVITWLALVRGTADDHRPLIILFTAFYLVAAATFDVWMMLRTRTEGFMPAPPAEGYKGTVLLLGVWIGIPTSEFLFDVLLEVELGAESYGLGNWLMVLLFGVVFAWIRRRGFLALIVEPEEETAKLAGFRTFDIPRGVYLIEQEKPEAALTLFSELVTLPLTPDASIPTQDDSPAATLEFLIPRGLVITREFPEKFRARYNLQVTPIIWLTESPGDRRIAPTSPAVLTDTLIRFMESNPNGIVLLEGVEYLATFNDFRKVLRQLDSLNETAWITKTRLLITIDPRAFEEKDLALLERDREVLRGEDDIEELKRRSAVRGTGEASYQQPAGT